ncbi:centromere-associated protein E-like [Dendronephthya gigantea]|uniref:centromere-associated protein E-like n=1 Tax=Dendronephthya gigantea TaxID=151771 RepID=UPI00106D6B15|nr:centromere-associated protein E-like [Dendronephthya gigantea]
MLNSTNTQDTSIRVAIRVRPLIKRENDCKDNWLVDENTICQIHDGKKLPNTTFTFDRIFSKDKSTIDLYMDFAKPIVLSVMEGINGTLFAYGQTSSGKTYTMSGTVDSPGIIPFALDEVFNCISKSQNREFLLRVSYMEIYNEIITDLLNPKSTNLRIRENVDREISVEKLTERVVTSVDEIIDVMKIGEKNRHIGGTNMNERSSRSHTIFRMVAESRETHSRNSIESGEFDGAVKVSHLNLVDLAGSERASVTGAEGIRLREGGFINKSLFALGNVINKLSEGESTFVPFRDSKLTRILQNSLGGNAKTSIICAVTPASTDETLSTLQFASRAKRIKNRPEVNEVLDDGTMLKRCRREISELKRQLDKSHTREEVLKREMELQMEKDMIQKELENQRKVADETKAKLRELANVFCTSKPKEIESKQRKQRRWTVCPMGARRKPLLTSSIDSEFNRPSRRLDLTYAGSPSRDLDVDISRAEFSVDHHQRFLEQLQEKEEEANIADQSVLSSVDEYRSSLSSANNQETRIAELESEVKRLIDERDALSKERDTIQNDLSENITSSCEMQEDLLRTKDKLKEKKKENHVLEERLHQFEALHANESNVAASEKNHIFERELTKYKTENEALIKELEAKTNELLESQKQGKELEEKVELLNVIQDDLATVDALQEELVQEQEKNKTLLEEIRQSQDDKEKLREELEHLGNFAGHQKNSVELEQRIKMVNEENNELRKKIDELDVVNSPDGLNEEIEVLKTRLREIEAHNAVLRGNCDDFKEKYHRVRSELDEKSSLTVKKTTEDSSEELLKAKEFEIVELQEKLELLTEKLSRKRRRASHHSSDIYVPSITPETESETILLKLLDELSKVDAGESPGNGKLDDVITYVKNYLSGRDASGSQNENRESSSSPNESEDDGALESTICRELVEIKQLRRASSTMQVFEQKETNDNDESETIKDLQNQLAEVLSSKETLTQQYDGFVEAFSNESKNELAEKESELKRQSEELLQLHERLAQELARNTELEERAKILEAKQDQKSIENDTKQWYNSVQLVESSPSNVMFEARNKDSPARKDFETQTEQNSPLSLATKEELLQSYQTSVNDLREDYFAELAKREEMFSASDKQREEELMQKETALQEMSSEIQRLRAKLDEVREDSTICTDLKDISVPHKEICANAFSGSVCENRITPERKRKLTPDTAEQKRWKNPKISQINDQSDEISDFENQLETKDILERSVAKSRQELEEKNLEQQDLMHEVEPVKENLEDDYRVSEMSVDGVENKPKIEMLPKDMELPRESLKIEKLEEFDTNSIFKGIAITEEASSEHGIKHEDEMGQKGIELQQKSLKIEESPKQLNASSDLVTEGSINERRSDLEEELSQKEIELQSNYLKIENLHKRLNDMAVTEASISELNEKLEADMLQKDIELQEKSLQIENLQKQLDTSRKDQAFAEESTNEFKNELEAEIMQKDKQLQQRSLEIENLHKKLNDIVGIEESITEPANHMAERIENLQEELYQRNEQVQEKICEIEHLKLLIGHQSENELKEELPLGDGNLQEELLDEVTEENADNLCGSGEETELEPKLAEARESYERRLLQNDISIAELKKKYEIELTEKSRELQEKQKEVDRLNRKLKFEMATLVENTDLETLEEELSIVRMDYDSALEEINILKDELETAKKLVLEHEACVAEVEARSLEEVSLIKEEMLAVVSQKESLERDMEIRFPEVEARFLEEMATLKRELEDVRCVQESLLKEYKARLVQVKSQYHEEISVLERKLENSVSDNANMVKEHESRISEVQTRLGEDFEKISSENEKIRKELIDLQGKYDAEVAKNELVIIDHLSSSEKRETELHEVMRSKEALVVEHEATVTRMNTEFTNTLEQMRSDADKVIRSKEALVVEHEATVMRMNTEFTNTLEQMRSDADESSKMILELKETLRKTENTRADSEKLLLHLNEKDEIIETKTALVAKLEEETKALIEAKEKMLEEHEATTEMLRQDFDDQIESIRQAVEEKERELVRAQDENVNTLRAELDHERERLKTVVDEWTTQVRDLERKLLDQEIQYEESLVEKEKLKEQVGSLVSEAKLINQDLEDKKNRVTELESEFLEANENCENLISVTEQRDSLQENLNATAEELKKSRDDVKEKYEKVLVLEKELNETNQAMEGLRKENEIKIEDLQQQNKILKTDIEKVVAENQNLKTDSEKHQAQLRKMEEQIETQKEMNLSGTETQLSEASCQNCRRRSGTRQGRRESEVFKLMLMDIKEQVGSEHLEQDKLIDELNHTLVTTQERLEQKEFVLDEKEIEILEKDEIVKELQEKLVAAEQLTALHENTNTELLTKLEQETAEMETCRAKLESAEEELLQAKLESEKSIEKLIHERNALQERVHDNESMFSEEQLRELYNSMEEKSQRIANLEQQLSEVHKKDSKICELEMEIDILQGEIASFNGRCDSDQVSIRELREVIREQETRIVELEACKAGLTLERDETIAGELRDLRVELESTRSRLVEFEEEKKRGMKVLQEKIEQLAEYKMNVEVMEENIQKKDEELREVTEKLEKTSNVVNEKEVAEKQTVQDLDKSKAELKEMKNLFETISCELERVKTELHDQRTDSEDMIKKLNSDVLVAEGAFKKAMSDKFEVDAILKEKQGDCEEQKEKLLFLEGQIQELEKEKSTELEEYKSKMMQLEKQYRDHITELTKENAEKDTSSSCHEKSSIELEEKVKEVADLNEQVLKAFRIVKKKEKECSKLNKALNECEEEITDFKNQIERLEDENEDLKNKLQGRDNASINVQQLQEQTLEVDTLRSRVSCLQDEIEHLRKLCNLNMEEELQKAKNELKTKEMDLFHVNFENTKQMDSAKRKIRELEKDVSDYARKNNELKAEIRGLRNRDEEPTIDVMRSKPKSSNGENVGVVGSVALFSLNARVEKLSEENKQLQVKSETLQKEVDKLGIINLDLKQNYGQILEKYKRLKGKFVNVVEKQQEMEGDQKDEHDNVDAKLQNGEQTQAGIKAGRQNDDSSISQHDVRSETTLGKQSAFKDRKNETKEPINQPPTSSEHTFRHNTSNSAFKPSSESAFRKPNVSADNASNMADKPVGPIPSQQATKFASVGLPRRVEQRKPTGRNPPSEIASRQSAGAMQPSNMVPRTTKDSATNDKTRNAAAFSRKNKENNLYNSGEKPDACKSQ